MASAQHHHRCGIPKNPAHALGETEKGRPPLPPARTRGNTAHLPCAWGWSLSRATADSGEAGGQATWQAGSAGLPKAADKEAKPAKKAAKSAAKAPAAKKANQESKKAPAPAKSSAKAARATKSASGAAPPRPFSERPAKEQRTEAGRVLKELEERAAGGRAELQNLLRALLLQLPPAEWAAAVRAPVFHKALVDAAEKGDADALRALVSAGAGVDHADDEGCTALYAATHNGRADAIRALLDSGATVDCVNNEGRTPLFMAARNNYPDIVYTLVRKAGAKVNHADNEGYTALFLAAEYGYSNVVRVLAEAGADVDHAVKDGRTPLGVARTNRQDAAAKALVQAGATEDVRKVHGVVKRRY